MEKLSSFFELISALNFAFVISTHFIKSISEKVCVQYLAIKGDLKSIVQIQHENFKKLVAHADYNSGHEIFVELNDKNEILQKRVDDIQEEIDLLDLSSSTVFQFNYLCLFGSLYPILFLILIGFDPLFDNAFFRHAIFSFNTLSAFLLIWLIKGKKQFSPVFKSGYYQVLIYFFFSLVFACIVGYMCRNLNTWNLELVWINKLLCVFIPSFHFAFYFIKTINQTKKTSNLYSSTLIQLQADCEDFANEMNITFNAVNKLKPQEVKS